LQHENVLEVPIFKQFKYNENQIKLNELYNGNEFNEKTSYSMPRMVYSTFIFNFVPSSYLMTSISHQYRFLICVSPCLICGHFRLFITVKTFVFNLFFVNFFAPKILSNLLNKEMNVSSSGYNKFRFRKIKPVPKWI
jgi:hypothetical protein